ncbi:MAG: response regulator transcription factor [Mariprofundaceae bacterium]|nr:response regulator transcription factor [Mariprofundaceae bacterium]
MSVKILVIEDDVSIARVMQLYLKKNGYVVDLCHSGNEALTILQSDCDYQLVILDRMLPGRNGMQLLRFIRDHHEDMPVLMVTAMSDVTQRVEGLTGGADDYLPKPFEPSELVARVQALLRRSKVSNQKMIFGRLIIDMETAMVSIDSHDLLLRPLELKLLHTLVMKRNRICSRGLLLDQVWGHDADVELRTVDVCIKRLRSAMKEHGMEACITTVRGLGYRFLEGECL